MAIQSAYLEENNLAPLPLSTTLFTETLYPMVRYGDTAPLGVKIAVVGGAFILSAVYAVIVLIEGIISIFIGLLVFTIGMIARSNTPEWIQKHIWICDSYIFHTLDFHFLLLRGLTDDYTPTPLELRIFNLLLQGFAFLKSQYLAGKEFDLLTG